MKREEIVILGSTGSIGRSTLEVIDSHPGRFNVIALAGYSNTDLLEKQYRRYRPAYIGVVDPIAGETLSERLKSEKVEVLIGEKEIVRLAGLEDADLVVNAVVGAAGLLASLETIKNGKRLALANKESLVTGGPLFPELLKKHGGAVLPIDSEHSAIWQALTSGKAEEVRKLIITASGGPFRTLPIDEFAGITPEMALNHPTWKMGRKITIDSATLANKGLEVIEAVTLFSVEVDKVEVVVHPQSIVHSMVEFVDSSIIAQMSMPDMRLPISYALFWPDRMESEFGRLEMSNLRSLDFEQPDLKRFPVLRLAFEVAAAGGTAPALYNAANEVAVEAFLAGSVSFVEISDIISATVEEIEVVSNPTLDDILEADKMARETAKQRVSKPVC